MQKRGKLSREAERLGISRQALWARRKRAHGLCGNCGAPSEKAKCDECKEPDKIAAQLRYRKRDKETKEVDRIATRLRYRKKHNVPPSKFRKP